MTKREKIIYKALEKVIDPEVGFNIVEMGLVYGVKFDGDLVEVKMTLTSPGCPLAPQIRQMVRDEVGNVEGVKKVKFSLVWEPVWTPAMMSENIRAEMGYD